MRIINFIVLFGYYISRMFKAVNTYNASMFKCYTKHAKHVYVRGEGK